MRKFDIIFVLLMSIIVPKRIYGRKEPRLPCHLRWAQTSEGSPVPFKSVAATEVTTSLSKMYIARINIQNEYIIGTLDRDKRKAYFALESENGTATSFQDFEILQNPYDCDVTWVSGNTYSNFRQFLSGTSLPHVGRVSYEGIWYPGSVDSSNTITAAIDNSTELIVTTDYQYLIVSSTGFQLEIRDFIFDPDIFGGNPTVMGYDEIHNLANCSITQTLTHTQTIKESKTVMMSVTKTSTKTTEVALNLLVYKGSQTKTETYSWTNQTEIKTETEIVISVAREIFVPPLESVIACSSIHFIEDFKANYVAKAIYRAKSLNSSEIVNILTEDNIKDLSVENGNVVLNKYDGTFQGSVGLNTEFIVSPFEGLEGCKKLVQDSNERQRQKFQSISKQILVRK